MSVIDYPIPYQSAFRPALFVLNDVYGDSGLDISILPESASSPLGVKRIYGMGVFSLNAAPYVRSLLDPQPICSKCMGMVSDTRRLAGCRVATPYYTSQVAYLTAGTEDAPVGRRLSASPEVATIRVDEKDEISVISGGGEVKPFILFTHKGKEYSVNSLSSNWGTEMHTFVVDTAGIVKLFVEMTGADAQDMNEFKVTLRVTTSSGDAYLTRRYVLASTPHNGCRLAWVNRYGAIDYYTFPILAQQCMSGSKERIRTANGIRVVATSTQNSSLFVSEYETAETLGWLCELLSSPRVWSVKGGVVTQVDTVDASALFDPSMPGNMEVKVNVLSPIVSRKL